MTVDKFGVLNFTKQLCAVGYVLYPSHSTLLSTALVHCLTSLHVMRSPMSFYITGLILVHKKCFHGTNLYLLTSFISLYLLRIPAEKLKKCEIEMQPNQAYETVSIPCPSKSAAQIHTELCPAYEDVVVQACN